MPPSDRPTSTAHLLRRQRAGTFAPNISQSTVTGRPLGRENAIIIDPPSVLGLSTPPRNLALDWRSLGCSFTWTVLANGTILSFLQNGLTTSAALHSDSDKMLDAESDEDLASIAQSFQIQRGAAQARMNDIRALKGMVLDWITPMTRGMVYSKVHSLYNQAYKHLRSLDLLSGDEMAQLGPAPEITLTSISYVTVQVRFALSSSTVFYAKDHSTASQ
ncbi:hypothetical protein DXG01_014082 [Tephrocybe rancida]|nr:hypothetical protein DXG01_014082 [Tephrocybe rancida]